MKKIKSIDEELESLNKELAYVTRGTPLPKGRYSKLNVILFIVLLSLMTASMMFFAYNRISGFVVSDADIINGTSMIPTQEQQTEDAIINASRETAEEQFKDESSGNMTINETATENITEQVPIEEGTPAPDPGVSQENNSRGEDVAVIPNITTEPDDTQDSLNKQLASSIMLPSLNIRDSSHKKVPHSFDILDEGNADYGMTISIKPTIKTVKNIDLRGVRRNTSIDIWFEEVPTKGTKWSQMYAIDLSMANFTDGTLTATANGDSLYKCKDWNFTQQRCMERCYTDEENDTSCYENWTLIQELIPGLEYTINLTPEDPAFAEVSEAVDVAVSPIDNTTFVVAWVDVAETDISFRVMDTNGTIITNTVDVDTTADLQSRVALTPINRTSFVIGWIDGPSDDATFAVYNINGSNIVADTDASANVGTNTDISLAQLGTRFAISYADDANDDASFKIYLNTGVQAVAETDIDTGMSAELTLQNLVSCTAMSSTRWAYFYFDDASNDATFAVRSDTGASIVAAADIDGDVGETAQMAVTALDNNKFAMAFYDSTDDDITIAIRNATNSVILAPSDIDTNAGTDSRLAISAIRANAAANNDSFVVAWWDQVSSDIKSAAYNGTGSQITAPFTVETQQDTTYRLIDVIARDPLTGLGICPGTFIVAYSNNSNVGMFKTYYINGTIWDGICNPPEVKLVSPSNGSTITVPYTNFTCNATDDGELKNMTFYWNYTGTWQANGTEHISGKYNTTGFYRTGLDEKTIIWNCRACDDAKNCKYAPQNWTLTANYTLPDTTPPASITNLQMQSKGLTWIYWNWTNPSDTDFSEAIVYINGTNVANTSTNHYNSTGLIPATYYTITVHTKDTSNNINYTDVNDTQSTLIPQLPPTTPTNITCNGGNCNATFYDYVHVNCSGSEDPNSDQITYLIDANLLAFTDFPDREAGEQTYSAGIITSVTSYNFDTCAPGTDCWAYENDVDQFPFGGNTANRNDHVEPTATEYTYISAPNANQWVTDDPGFGDEMLLWNEFNIAENATIITNMTFAFYGSIAGAASTNFATWLLQAGQPWETDASWTQLGATQSIGQTDIWMYRSIDSGFSTYVGTGGLVTWGISEAVSSESMRINFVEVNVTSQSLKDNEYNDSSVEYTSIGGANSTGISTVHIHIQVSSYDPTGSAAASNTRPDLEVGIWNGTGYKTGHNCGLVSHYGDYASSMDYNCTVSSTDPAIIDSWNNSSQRMVEVRALYLDTEGGNNDSVSWTDVWSSIEVRNWSNIGNHTQTTTLYWNLSGIPEQTGVGLRCRAIDLSGSNNHSDYYAPSTNLTISINDTQAPAVTINYPIGGEIINQIEPIIINVSVTDDYGVDKVLADISKPINGIETIPLIWQGGDTYALTFTNTAATGRYNITIRANDTHGNINNTETSWFNVTLYLPLQDNQSNNITSDITILADYGNGTIDVQILPNNHSIHNITIYGYNTLLNGILYLTNQTADELFERTYSIDLSGLDFSTAAVTLTAQGNSLLKCAEFNFTTQTCNDTENYIQIRTDLVTGQNYTIFLNAIDPGFGEISNGTANINDSWSRSGAPNLNNGASPFIRAGRATAANIIRGIIKFQLPELPAGANITNAELKMHFFNIPAGDVTTSRTHGVYRVTQSPPRNWTEFGVTWNNYTATSLWTIAGGDYNATPTDTKILNSTYLNSMISYNVTIDVLSFYANKSANFGWVIRDTLENVNNARRDYRSKEATNAAQRPVLIINYTVPIVINNITDSPDPVAPGQNVTIIANITADYGVSSAWVDILGTNYSMSRQNESAYRKTIEYMGFENPATELPKWSEDINSPAYPDGVIEIVNSTHPFTNAPPFTTHSGNYVLAFAGDTVDVLAYGNRSVNLSGYKNVTVSMWKAEESTEAADQFQAYYWNGTAWVQMWSDVDATGNGAMSAWQQFNISIPDAAATDRFQLQIRWETSIADPGEHMFIDDINITGIPVSINNNNWQLSHNTTGELGVVSYTVYANDTLSNVAEPKTGNYTVDSSPPGTVTNLAEQYVGGNWIQWNWTNPTDPDFSHVQIWMNGTFYANVYSPTNYINVSPLAPNTVYEIETRTADNISNVNMTWVNDTAKTLQLNGSIQLDNTAYEQGGNVVITGLDWDAFNNVTLNVLFNGSSVAGYPKNLTANFSGGFIEIHSLPLNTSVGMYNVTAFQVTNTSKNDLEQFNVTSSTGPPAYQPLRAGLELYLYLPPLHNPFGARPEDPFLAVTAFNDNTSLYVEDQNGDGDSDDSRGNATNKITLNKGQSILIYIANGTNNDSNNGDYFKVVADSQVAVWGGSNSPFMAYTVPSESGMFEGEEFYLYGRYDPDFTTPLDMIIFAYENNTNVRIYDITGTATRQDFTNNSGYTNVTTPSLSNLISNMIINEGQHISYINNSLTPGGHTYYVAANKPVTMTAGSLREGSDYGGVENFGRDGPYYSVGKGGVTYSKLFYTYVTRGGANLGEDEMYFFSDRQSSVTMLTYWNNGTLNNTYNFQLNASNDYFYPLVGTNSSPYKKITATEPIAVLGGAWINQGTGDMADFGTSIEGSGVGKAFNVYVPEPGGTNYSHAILFAFYNNTYYAIYNSTNDALLANGTINRDEHYDFLLTTDAHLIINTTKSVGVEITNYDDNVGLYAVASPIGKIVVTKTSAEDEILLGQNITFNISIYNPSAVTFYNVTIEDIMSNYLSYVETTQSPGLGGPYFYNNTPTTGATTIIWNKSVLYGGETVNITIITTPFAENETLFVNNVDVNGTDAEGNTASGEDSAVVFVYDGTAPNITSYLDAPDPQQINRIVNISAIIIDNVFVSNAVVQINGTNYSMIYAFNNSWYYQYNGTQIGTYNYTIYAWDAKYNNATPVNGSFTITPSALTPPFVILNTPPAGFTQEAFLLNVTFNCSATDNIQLRNISLYITNSTNQSFSLNKTTLINGTINSSQWNLTLTNGNYTWNCRAYDSDNNSAYASENRTILLTIPNYPPSKVNLTFPNNGNNTLLNRSLMFIWQPATDPESATLSYEINITSSTCPNIFVQNITQANYTHTTPLGTYEECGSYNWSVRAYDGVNLGNWSDSWNFSIQPYVAFLLLNLTVNFQGVENGEINDTTDDNPLPFLLKNDGNVFADIINVTVNQSIFLSSLSVPSDFQIKAANSTQPGAFNWSGSATDWINLTTIIKLIDRLNWRASNNTAEIETKIHVPVDEPAGVRVTGLVFYGEQSP